MATKTWIYTGGTPSNYRTAGNWSPSGIPTAADDVIFNSVSVGSCIILLGNTHLCASITTTGYTGTISGSAAWSISGGMVLGSSTVWTYTGIITFNGASSFSITTNGVPLLGNVTLINATGNWSIIDNFSTTGTITLTQGTLSVLNSSNITCNVFNSGATSVRALNMGNGLWTLTGENVTVWNSSSATNMTFNAEQSTILINNTSNNFVTFIGQGYTYNIIQFSRGSSIGDINLLSGNTYFNLIDNGTAAHFLYFSGNATNTFSNFNVSGSVGNNIGVQSVTISPLTFVKIGTGVVSVDFLNIRNSQASPANTWYAGANSVSVGVSNTGWIFTAPPSNTSKNLLLLGVG